MTLTPTAGSSVPLRRSPAEPGLSAWWLGQAGFLIESAGARLLVDGYLSDSLAVKYRGKPLPHVRMAPPPVEPGALRDLDLVLATHDHLDHLDPDTLGPIAAGSPACRFVVPAPCAELAVSRGVPPDRLVPAVAFTPIELAGVRIHPLPSAHEELTLDAAGRHLFLGYVLELPGGVAVYHPGDCIPYPALRANLARHRVDLALLPVNGRDAQRTAAGILGNFTLEEAMDLARGCGFGAVIGHHFGLFDFNTVDVPAARARVAAQHGLPPFLLAEPGVRYQLPAAARPEPRRTAGP
jgi:L-ascorbate metabolism protein UlaG (beta-lactamase superfamily)